MTTPNYLKKAIKQPQTMQPQSTGQRSNDV